MSWREWLQPKGTLARGVGVLVGGTAAAQLITVLAAPILTRLYSPEAFGTLAVFVAILTLCTVAAAARYELAIPVPEKNTDAANLTLLCVIISVFFSAVVAVAFFLFSGPIASVLNAPKLDAYLWIIPFAVLAGVSVEVFSKLCVRDRNFKLIANTRIIQTCGTASIQILGSSFGVIGLVAGQAIGQALGSVRLVCKSIPNYPWSECSFKGLKEQAYIYRRYPQYSLWSALFNTVSLQLAPLVFVASYGAVVAGLYALTLRVLSLPGGLIGGAIGSVFLAEAPAAIRRNQLKPLILTLHTSLARLGALPLVVLLFFGEDLFKLVFGESWARAGMYAQIMAPWIYLQFQWGPLSTVGNLLELQQQILVTHVLNFFIRFSVLTGCAFYAVPADSAVVAFAAVSAIIYFFIIIWFFRKAGLTIKEVVMTDLKYISLALLICLPFYICIMIISDLPS